MTASLTVRGMTVSVGSEFPLAISSNARFFQNSSGAPYLIRGDTPWELVKMSPSDRATYLDDRQAKGFNAIIIEGPISPDEVPVNYAGDPSFNGTTGGESDLSTPNTNWFAWLATLVADLQARHMAAFVFPLYLGFGGGSEGLYQSMVASGSTKTGQYGTYIGNLLKGFPNVVYVLGGDYLPDASGLSLNKVMSDAIQAVDAAARIYSWHCGPNEQTYELDSVTAGYRASVATAPNFTNWEYSYESSFGNEYTHWNALNCYGSSPTTPVFLGEAHYEYSPPSDANPKLLRREYWGAMLSGAIGCFHGQEGVWNFQTGWQAKLNSSGTVQKVIMDNFFAARDWSKLVPSQGVGLVTVGGGTVNTFDYNPRALASDGSWGAVQFVNGGSVTVNYALFNATKTAKWFDPSNGDLSPIGSHGNSGTQSYTIPGNNSVGENDWVLVIE